MKQYHILNGDALKSKFPKNIKGEILVARECLVDGDVRGNNLVDLFNTRAQFLSNTYKGCTKEEYFKNTVTEFQKMKDIPDNININLWFEDDLFCQVNFWFIINLLHSSHSKSIFFLIRPTTHNQYGFGRLNASELTSIYENRCALTQIDVISKLWSSYQNNDTESLLVLAKQLKKDFPFVLTAVKAHIDRIPTKINLGRPILSLVQIMKDLNTEEFGIVFKEFNKRESIYGFGDLQVKRLYDQIINNR